MPYYYITVVVRFCAILYYHNAYTIWPVLYLSAGGIIVHANTSHASYYDRVERRCIYNNNNNNVYDIIENGRDVKMARGDARHVTPFDSAADTSTTTVVVLPQTVCRGEADDVLYCMLLYCAQVWTLYNRVNYIQRTSGEEKKTKTFCAKTRIS